MSERWIDELLEEIWVAREEEVAGLRRDSPALVSRGMRQAVEDALKRGLAKDGQGLILLTPQGEERARVIIRSHRLVERLFHDVLDAESQEVESSACKFEHSLSADAANSVCILLGHPTVCPHNKPIPPGQCCQEAITDARPLVFPAIWLKPGETATVAYIGTRDRTRLNRLANLGILPGSRVRLAQRRPSYVLQVGETELGLADSIVREIYVRRAAPVL